MNLVKKDKLKIIGLNSGMSRDGIDLCFCTLAGDFPNINFSDLSFHSEPYSHKVSALLDNPSSLGVKEVAELDVLIAKDFARVVNNFLEKSKISARDVDLIGSHGQTLYHQSVDPENVSTSLQVGSLSYLSQLTKISVIGNFRMADMAVEGQGAPISPILDYILSFAELKSGEIAFNNLGSISNLCVLSQNTDNIIAFDCGPANMLIDFFANKFLEKTQGCDLDGRFSAEGKIFEPFVEEILANDFFKKKPPKAAGFKDFGAHKLEELFNKYKDKMSDLDFLRSSVEVSARSTAEAYHKWVLPKFPALQKVKFSGGGVKNTTLMKRLTELMSPLNVQVIEQEEYIHGKEAMLFALLAYLKSMNIPANFPSVTGAAQAVPLGEFALFSTKER